MNVHVPVPVPVVPEREAAPAPPARVDTDARAIASDPGMTLVLSMTPMSEHPIGRRLGPLIAALPAWRELLRAAVADPVRDLDWVYATGPGVAGAATGVTLLGYSGTDAAIDAAVDALARQSTAVTSFELGVAGARGTLAKLDDGARVLLRAHPKLLAAAPPDRAKSAAAALVRARVRPPAQDPEALALDVRRPHDRAHQVPEAIRRAHVRVLARADGGAEVFADGECDDVASANAAADELRATIRRVNGFLVRLATANLLDRVEIQTENEKIKLHLVATRDQLQATLGLAAASMGADIGRDTR